MITVNKKLSKDQVQRGVIFASTFSTQRFELSTDTTHEVFNTDKNSTEKIDRLCDTSFFKNSHFKFNIIRQ